MSIESKFFVEVEPSVPKRDLRSWIAERRWFLFTVILPTLLASLYYAFIATDVFTSEARFVIKSADQKRGQMSTIANLIQTTGLSGGQEQTNEILDFVRSRDALAQLERSLNIRSRYGAPNGDILSRYPRLLDDNSFEDLYKYYTKTVSAKLDTETSTAIVTVHAFTPRDAFEINKQLLNQSEQLVNRLNGRARTRGISEAQRQVELALARSKTARIAMARYRNSRELIDPAKQASGVIEIANTLIVQRAALQAQLDQMVRLAPAHPSILAVRQRIVAISAQIASQDSRVSGNDTGIASQLGEYENLLVEQEFANENLNVANAALVQARAEAQRQNFYLERVVEPNWPDSAMRPKRFLAVLTIFAALSCLYFVIWMLVVGVLEHSPDE